MKRKSRKTLHARAGVVLLRAAFKLKSGEVVRMEEALQGALRETGMTRAALKEALGTRGRTLGLTRPRRRPRVSHPMR
jgi:hypothetical protein